MPRYTPTEKDIMDILSDGQPHPRKEILERCGGIQPSTLSFHLTTIRNKLRPIGQGVLCDGLNGHYRLVRFITSDR